MPGIEDGGLYAGVGAHKEDHICLIGPRNGRVHDVVAAHVCVVVREAAIMVQVAASQAVHKVLQHAKAMSWQQYRYPAWQACGLWALGSEQGLDAGRLLIRPE